MITAQEIGGDEDLALRALAHARSIAPRIDDVAPGVLRDSVIAIVRAAAKQGATSSQTVRSQRVGSAGVDYNTAASWFSDDDKTALRALSASDGSTVTGGPVGSFPVPGLITKVWPEQYAL